MHSKPPMVDPDEDEDLVDDNCSGDDDARLIGENAMSEHAA